MIIVAIQWIRLQIDRLRQLSFDEQRGVFDDVLEDERSRQIRSLFFRNLFVIQMPCLSFDGRGDMNIESFSFSDRENGQFIEDASRKKKIEIMIVR